MRNPSTTIFISLLMNTVNLTDQNSLSGYKPIIYIRIYEVDIYERFTIPGVTLTLRIDGGITSVEVDNRFIVMPEVTYLDT